ncbi:MAG: protein kinase [Kofleriaceae bacterium]
MAAAASAPLVVSATRATWLATFGDHPNLVRILGVHHVDSGPRLMLEQVPGRDLEALLDAAVPGPLPLPEVLAIVRDCARGLHFLHELRDQRGTAVRIVHGTVAPALVTVGFDGVARVAGLERLCATSGAPRPDPAYAAPEQSVDGGAVDRRADVFALAALLVRAASGIKLRDGVLPVPTYQALPHLPQAIEDLVRRALAAEPSKRPGTAEELRAALESCAVREGLLCDADQVARLVLRLAPPVAAPVPPPVLPPRPDQSLWSGESAARPWFPVEPVIVEGPAPTAAGFDVISVAAPRPAGRPAPTSPPHPVAPAAGPVAPTLTVAALVDAAAPHPPPGPPPPAPSDGLPPVAHLIALPAYHAAPPPLPLPSAAQFMTLPEPEEARPSLLRDPLFLVGVSLVLFFAALVIAYLASG